VRQTVRPVTAPIRVRCSYSAPSDALWRAISEPSSLARWLGRCDDLVLEEGQPFALQLPARPWFDGAIDAEVRHVDAGRTWQMAWRHPALGGESLARLSVISTPDGSRLEITHDGLAAGPAMRALHLAGWTKVLRVDLARLLRAR
jgi:uncharacterized protein YndB with AHSA1/START domain